MRSWPRAGGVNDSDYVWNVFRLVDWVIKVSAASEGRLSHDGGWLVRVSNLNILWTHLLRRWQGSGWQLPPGDLPVTWRLTVTLLQFGCWNAEHHSYHIHIMLYTNTPPLQRKCFFQTSFPHCVMKLSITEHSVQSPVFIFRYAGGFIVLWMFCVEKRICRWHFFGRLHKNINYFQANSVFSSEWGFV